MADGKAVGKEAVDLITEIQGKLGNILGLMYSCTGAIQRDAPAASVRGEEALSRSSAPLGDTATMAKEIVEASHSIDTLLQRLPESFGTEEEELERIDSLQRQRAEICREVQRSQEAAEQTLAEVQRVHGAIADDMLQGLEHR